MIPPFTKLMFQQEIADMYIIIPALGRMQSALSEIYTKHCKSERRLSTEETI